MRPAPPPTPLANANSALRSARTMRAEWSVGVAEGLLTSVDVIEHACTVEGRPLRRMKLRQLLLSQPHWGQARTGEAMTRFARFAGLAPSADLDELTAGWLIDSRAGGRRISAWLDAVEVRRDGPPWPGFPYLRKPA